MKFPSRAEKDFVHECLRATAADEFAKKKFSKLSGGQKQRVLIARAMATTLGKNVLLWDVLLYLLIGVTVSMAVLSVGPLISFGFLLIPALTAHLFARNMK